MIERFLQGVSRPPLTPTLSLIWWNVAANSRRVPDNSP